MLELNKLAYTIITDKKYFNEYHERKKNVDNVRKYLDKKIKYIDSEVIFINTLEDYKTIKKQNIDVRKINIIGKFRLGAVGLAFTTYLTYLKLEKEPYDAFLIIEDDAEISNNSLSVLQEYLKEIPNDFDIISLYENSAYYNKYTISHDIGLKNVCLFYNDKSTLAYIISKNGIVKYLYFMKKVIDAPIDLFLFDKNKNTKKYAIKPNSEQVFFNKYFLDNGDPNFDNSLINKTIEITFTEKQKCNKKNDN
jgi:hypothetical protein